MTVQGRCRQVGGCSKAEKNSEMPKAHANVIIAKTGRDTFLDVCLFYLDKAASVVNFNVNVYVIDTKSLHLPTYKSIKVKAHQLAEQKLFNKAILLNYGLNVMKRGFWFVSIIDVDMIYSQDFFVRLGSTMTKWGYIFSTGVYLTKKETEEFICNRPETVSIIGEYPKISGPSQVTMHSNVYQLFNSIYGSKLYCEEFAGWGGEDSDLSYRAREMHKAGLIYRQELTYVWYHMYHDNDKRNAIINKNLYLDRKALNKDMLQKFLNKNREVCYEQVS